MPGTPNISTIDQSISSGQGFAPGIGLYTVNLPVTLATLTNALQFVFTPNHKGRLIKAVFVTHTPATTAAKLATLTPSVGGVNMAGGVIALTTASCDTRGEQTDGTPITGLNSFSATGVLTWTGSAVTAFIEGNGHLQMTIMNDDTLEALAKALFGLRTP